MKILHWLTVLFVALKLTGHIDWSWWLVFAPTLIDVAGTLLVAVVILMWADS